jgi:hypothetical protein
VADIVKRWREWRRRGVQLLIFKNGADQIWWQLSPLFQFIGKDEINVKIGTLHRSKCRDFNWGLVGADMRRRGCATWEPHGNMMGLFSWLYNLPGLEPYQTVPCGIRYRPSMPSPFYCIPLHCFAKVSLSVKQPRLKEQRTRT